MHRLVFWIWLPSSLFVASCTPDPSDSGSTKAQSVSTSSTTVGSGGANSTASSTTTTTTSTSTDTGSTTAGGATSTISSVGGSTTGAAEGGTGGEAGADQGPGSGGSGATQSTCPGEPYEANPLPDDTTPDQVCSGMTFTEGPVWIGSTLYFSDFQIRDTQSNFLGDIIEYTPGGTCAVWLADTGTNGLAIGPDGNLLGANHTTQTLTSYDLSTKTATVLVADYMGQNFSSPNDLTVRSDGNIYFTDPAHQLGNRMENLPQSAYRRTPEGELSVIEVLDGRRPNGITLSPDESLLYVAVINPGEILVYDVDSSGATSASGTLVDNGSDGMAIDCAGNLYLTSSGVEVYSPDGASLGSIDVPGSTTNVAFGGPDHRTLYITAGASLYAVLLNVPGLPY